MGSVLILDTETTSKNDDREVIELAWLKIAVSQDMLGGNPAAIPAIPRIEKIFEQRYKPTKPITFGSMAIHHIIPSELEHCPPASAMVPFEGIDYPSHIIGHSIDFDWEALGCPDIKRIDTHSMSHHVWPDADGYSLGAMTYMLRGASQPTRHLLRSAHSAKADCFLTLALLLDILNKRPEISTWSALWQFSEECRVPLTMPMARWRGIKLVDMEQSAIDWCLRQDWIDPYLRIGLERVCDQRFPRSSLADIPAPRAR